MFATLIKIEKEFSMGGVEGHGPLTLGSTDSQAGCLGHMCQFVGHGLLLDYIYSVSATLPNEDRDLFPLPDCLSSPR